MHVIGKDDPGVDMKRCSGAHLPNGVAQRVDARHQQVRPTVEQVHCKEERPTRNPIAPTIRHVGNMPDLGEWRNALRCSALRLLKALGLSRRGTTVKSRPSRACQQFEATKAVGRLEERLQHNSVTGCVVNGPGEAREERHRLHRRRQTAKTPTLSTTSSNWSRRRRPASTLPSWPPLDRRGRRPNKLAQPCIESF